MNTFRILWIIAVCLLLAFRLSAQTCDHTSDAKARFDEMRVLPPSKIFWDGRTITATFREGTEILTTDKDSVLHIPNDYKTKLFWIVYSNCDHYTYVVDEVLPSQMKKPDTRPAKQQGDLKGQ